jgi:hypothetical protein
MTLNRLGDCSNSARRQGSNVLGFGTVHATPNLLALLTAANLLGTIRTVNQALHPGFPCQAHTMETLTFGLVFLQHPVILEGFVVNTGSRASAPNPLTS